MTRLLARAFEEASRLPTQRQDQLAQALLDDLAQGGPPPDPSAQAPRKAAEIADGALMHLTRTGWLTPPAAISQEPPPRVPVAPFCELMEELGDDRGER